MIKVPTLNKNKKEEDNTKKWEKNFSVLEQIWRLDLKIIDKLKLNFWRSFNPKNIYYERCKQIWTLKLWIRENKSFSKNVKVLRL